MADSHNRTYSEQVLALPPGEWINRHGIQVFIPDQPELRFADLCHCGDYFTGRSCPSCLAWAERDARLWAESRQRRANRSMIWDVLAARKRVAA